MQLNEWSQISQFQSFRDSPGFLLWKTQITWRRLIEKALQTHGLTHPQFVILTNTAYLTKNDTLVTQVELAKHVSCDITTTSQILRCLEKKGLIKRINKAGNEKSKYPQLTELGYKILKPAIKTVEEVDKIFFNLLAPSELNNFKQIALKLVNDKISS